MPHGKYHSIPNLSKHGPLILFSFLAIVCSPKSQDLQLSSLVANHVRSAMTDRPLNIMPNTSKGELDVTN